MVAYGAEDWFERSLDAALASTGVDVDVVVVDNGCTDGGVDRIRGRDGVEVVCPLENLGFAGGGNLGVRHARGAPLCRLKPHACPRAEGPAGPLGVGRG